MGVSLSSDASRLVTVGADKAARAWEMAKVKEATKDLDKPALSIALPAGPLSVSLSPNGQCVAAGVEAMGKEQVLVIDAASGKELLTLGEDGTMPARTVRRNGTPGPTTTTASPSTTSRSSARRIVRPHAASGAAKSGTIQNTPRCVSAATSDLIGLQPDAHERS